MLYTRIIFLLLLLLIGFIAPWWCLAPLAAWYALRYRAYELLFLGFALDLAYGPWVGSTVAPVLYTTGAFCMVMIAETLKPRLKNM